MDEQILQENPEYEIEEVRHLSEAADRLGSHPVHKLLFTFSIPAITGLVVNALYNIVDRVFVGRGVGEAALGGISLIMPLMTIVFAFAILFGVGAGNLISIRLGEGRKDLAQDAVNHCFWLLIVAGAILTLVGVIFLDPLLSVLGAQEGSQSLIYAKEFMRVIFFGCIFSMVSMGFAHCIRAQGFPTITMIGLIIGAVLNIGLVPIFIFVLHWGVAGAAWATVIAQAGSGLWFISFGFSKKVLLRLRPFHFKPSLKAILRIMSFGSAQSLLQLAMSFVIVVYNYSMSKYGVEELNPVNGGDVALSGMNIVNSVSMLVLMVIFGISQGAQPILGYNYGAKKFDRVLKTYKHAVIAATVVSCIGFALLHIFPEDLVRLFAPDGSSDILTFGTKAMNIATLAMPIVGFQIVSTNLFVVTGRPKTSMLLSLTRQVVLLVPAIYLLGLLQGLIGVIIAAPIADALSSLLTAGFIVVELRKLRTASAESRLESNFN